MVGGIEHGPEGKAIRQRENCGVVRGVSAEEECTRARREELVGRETMRAERGGGGRARRAKVVATTRRADMVEVLDAATR